MPKKLWILCIILSIALSGCSTKPQKSDTEKVATEFLLDTVCTIKAGGENADEAIESAFLAISEIQRLTDYYSENSVVSTINDSPAGRAIKLDDTSFEIIKTALEVCEKSGGAFDITIAPVSDLWNFKTDTPALPQQIDINQALTRIGYKKLYLDTTKKSITKLAEGVKIDLGGVSKGYAADRSIEILKSFNVDYATVDLGGNVCVLGKNPATDDGHFRIGIQAPFQPTGTYSQTVDISGGTVVTSGTYQRNFKIGNTLYHHIINPADGYPVQNGMASVSIIAESSLLADCLSTACFVLGEEKGTALAESYHTKILWFGQDGGIK